MIEYFILLHVLQRSEFGFLIKASGSKDEIANELNISSNTVTESVAELSKQKWYSFVTENSIWEEFNNNPNSLFSKQGEFEVSKMLMNIKKSVGSINVLLINNAYNSIQS